MSLISEALRKARQQAAEQGDADQGVAYPQISILRPRGARLGTGLVLGAVIALAAALAGAAVVWWALGLREEPEVMTQRGVVEVTPQEEVDGAASSGAPVRDEIDVPSTAPLEMSQMDAAVDAPAETAHPLPTPRPSADQTAADRTIVFGSRSEPAPVQDDDGSDTAEGTTSPAHAGSPARQGVYLIEADLGHITLTLDFIAFRPDDPFAEINGLEVHVGSRIEGFTVERIERKQVHLRDEEGSLILRAP